MNADPRQAETDPEARRLARYEALRDRGVEATRHGRLQEARDCFVAAVEAARHLDETIQERAFCNLAALDVERGEVPASTVARLRSILTNNGDGENCRSAAYHLARLYDLRKDYKKALFYARIASERSKLCGRAEWLASSHNQTGSLLLAESRFDEAEAELEAALELSPAGDAVHQALILDNLGYCRVVQGDVREGFRCLFEGLRIVRRVAAGSWEQNFHLTLCFAYLELGRWRHAARHGLRAFDAAERAGDANSSKNALFLLGETANLAGDPDLAYTYFSRLQERFYPQHDFLPDFLLAVDVRGLVNLKA